MSKVLRLFAKFSQCLRTYIIFRAEEEGEDLVDSDFSIDENDEPVSDNEDGEGQKKKRRLVTKAYKVGILNIKYIGVYCIFYMQEPVSTPKEKTTPKPKSAIPKIGEASTSTDLSGNIFVDT